MSREFLAQTETRLAAASEQSLIERWFPYRELSIVAAADRRAKDPKYAAHTWWARRPPGVFRGILLASALDARTRPDEFWRAFASSHASLRGLRIEDPFAGGGTTAMEASRLGALPIASDVDPLAVEIVRHQLSSASEDALRALAEELLDHLRREVGHFYRPTNSEWLPLHYFFLRSVTCPACSDVGLLYRDLLIARDPKKPGSVIRAFGAIAFCPDCLELHELDSADRHEIRCCGKRRQLTEGTFRAQHYTCQSCGAKSSHRQLRTGIAPTVLIAIEETHAEELEPRRFRKPTKTDARFLAASQRHTPRCGCSSFVPNASMSAKRSDDRPLSYGVTQYRQLFSHRQQALFGHAFEWLSRQSDASPDLVRALTLAVSSALATNNLLCGYARDYGRLSALFSVRGYSLPALSVELNPLHPTAGRGTLVRTLERVCRSTSDECTRNVWVPSIGRAQKVRIEFTERERRSEVTLGSAGKPTTRNTRSDLCVFDPPYFDYIKYDELSAFYRTWLGMTKLGGRPLLPEAGREIESFSQHLSECLKAMCSRLNAGRPLIFTFHSASADAWKAIGFALDRAEFKVTALWPVKTDTHMGHHSHEGNCEWDIVIACRPSLDCRPIRCPASVDDWFSQLRPLHIRPMDREGMRLSVEMAQLRFGHLWQRASR